VQVVKQKSSQGAQDKVGSIIEKLVQDYAKSSSANHRKACSRLSCCTRLDRCTCSVVYMPHRYTPIAPAGTLAHSLLQPQAHLRACSCSGHVCHRRMFANLGTHVAERVVFCHMAYHIRECMAFTDVLLVKLHGRLQQPCCFVKHVLAHVTVLVCTHTPQSGLPCSSTPCIATLGCRQRACTQLCARPATRESLPSTHRSCLDNWRTIRASRLHAARARCKSAGCALSARCARPRTTRQWSALRSSPKRAHVVHGGPLCLAAITKNIGSAQLTQARARAVQGGLLCLAAIAVGLGSEDGDRFLGHIVPPVLESFRDPDGGVRCACAFSQVSFAWCLSNQASCCTPLKQLCVVPPVLESFRDPDGGVRCGPRSMKQAHPGIAVDL
jgi:Vacuolar 14 Fab1-binding region